MAETYFRYKRSARRQAIKMLIISIGFPISMWGMVEAFAKGRLTNKEELIIYGSSIVVSIFLFFIFVIPDLKKKGSFIFEVTNECVRCSNPNGEEYEVDLEDISRLLQIKRATGNLYSDELIETKDGSVYLIPKKYDLNIYDAIKAIRKAAPEVSRENEVRY